MLPEKKKPQSTEMVELKKEVKTQATVLAAYAGSMWGLEAIDFVLGGRLDQFGIHPRTVSGLLGILFAPFLHGGFGHLIANTGPLLVLSFIIMQRKKRDLLYVSVISGLISGLGTWLIAPSNSVHIGASGVIFGYLGYLIARGYYERKFWAIVGSILVLVLYGGALFGIFPGDAGISWQGHLFGLIGGVVSARVMSNEAIKVREKKKAMASGSAPAGKTLKV
jgi:membrane associated rhomboid family serine protease